MTESQTNEDIQNLKKAIGKKKDRKLEADNLLR